MIEAYPTKISTKFNINKYKVVGGKKLTSSKRADSFSSTKNSTGTGNGISHGDFALYLYLLRIEWVRVEDFDSLGFGFGEWSYLVDDILCACARSTNSLYLFLSVIFVVLWVRGLGSLLTGLGMGLGFTSCFRTLWLNVPCMSELSSFLLEHRFVYFHS